MSKPSVSVENVSKKFGLTLKEGLKYGIIDSLRRAFGQDKVEKLRDGEFWALNDVSFELNPGDALGIMGVNGSGKTTLLRILNGTYSPDKGKVTMRGRLGALIAAGAGFSPMLTGRENVFISGALLGMRTKEIRRRFDEIVAFAELEDFIDMPVRNYSSGMSVRLGFAVAALGTPDVLLVDEVLAVGDLSFQKKCFERIFSLRDNGTTILLVSHSIGAVWSMCNKGLLLHHGIMMEKGDVEQVCKTYDDYNTQAVAKSMQSVADTVLPSEYGHNRGGTGDIVCLSVSLKNSKDENINTFSFRDRIIVEQTYRVISEVRRPIFRASIDSVHYKYFVSVDSYEQGLDLDRILPGEYLLRYTLNSLELRPGAYSLNTSVTAKEVGVHIFYWLGAAQFSVTHAPDIFLYSNDKAVVYFNAKMEIVKC